MSTELPSGPVKVFKCPGGAEAPFYMLPFDKRGICQAPETRRQIVEQAQMNSFSDIFVFTHGWNTDWQSAVNNYETFIEGFRQMLAQFRLPVPASFRPLLVGIHWPSAALVWTEAEQGPALAAEQPMAVSDAELGEALGRIRDLADALPAADAPRFYALLQQPTLNRADAAELAQLVAGVYDQDLEELHDNAPVAPETIADGWFAVGANLASGDDFGGVIIPSGAAAPAAAGAAQSLDPRQVIRVLTVYQMKDRAGVVGAFGVSELLRDLLKAPTARVHAIGHSYGCRVMLSALCHDTTWPRPIASMLLLQGAISHLCFAKTVPGTTRAGGYRIALDRVQRPILATYSARDFPLHDVFHFIMCRDADLGEMRIAAATGQPPNRYAALGGYGPRQAGEALVDVCDTGARYDLDGGQKVIGIDATRTIPGHSDINNLSTWWALYNLLTTGL